MISTVTLNPSLDTVVVVEEIEFGEVNRSEIIFSYPGGKGIDVSRTIRKLGGETCALGVVAGNNGETITKLLDEEGIPHDFLKTGGNVRNNILLEAKSENKETIILHRGEFQASETLAAQLKEKIRRYAERSDVMVLAGSVPPIFPASIYRELITIVRQCGCKAILDTSGPPLQAGIEASPYMIKPNRRELEQLLGRVITSLADVRSACEELGCYGIPLIMVSLGGEGVAIRHDDVFYHVSALETECLSYAGAGDCLVGGVALGISRQADMAECTAMGVAAATATLSEYGSSYFNMEKYEIFKRQVSVREV